MAEKRTRRRFTVEFEAEAVKRLLEGGEGLTEVATELGLSPGQLGAWRNERLAAGSAEALGHRQVDAGEDREARSLIGATASCGSLGARDFGPDREGLRPDGSVLGGGEVIAVEMEEIVDLIVGGEEPLRLAG
jgi:transposase